MSSSDKLKIPLQEIIKATGKFSEENIIGRGGYGYVYRGQSEIHGMLAIKRLIVGPQGHGDHEYGTEVELLSKYKHENLVSLIGYCGEGRERILVYKYEANGSLDKVLQSSDLSWMCRLQICLDAALGLTYLHNASGSGHGVIHRDIKSSNILLDENWKAKLSDFGLSKLTLSKSADSLIFTVACGTAGYIDPEYFRECILTQKSDVYSFGVVLFEVLFGKLVGDPCYGGFTTKIAKKHYETKTLDNMIHTGLKDQMNPDSLSTFSSIAYECLNDLRKDRPTMGSVVEALEKALSYQQVRHRSESYGLSSSEFLYDVYISFRVEVPTTYIFDDLCDALEREGLSTCKDNMSYSRNESGLLSAIRKSRSFIILFSKKFAANSWNLEEVAEIVKCVKERGDVIIPVYSDVYPSEVREEKGYFGEAMSKYDTHPSMNAWRNALLEATNVSALEYSNFESYKHLAKEAAMRIKGKSKSTKPNVRRRVKRAARCEVKENTHT